MFSLTATPARTHCSLTATCAPCVAGSCQPLPINSFLMRATRLGLAAACWRPGAHPAHIDHSALCVHRGGAICCLLATWATSGRTCRSTPAHVASDLVAVWGSSRAFGKALKVACGASERFWVSTTHATSLQGIVQRRRCAAGVACARAGTQVTTHVMHL